MTRPRLDDLPDVLDPSTVADLLGIGENATYRALARGEIPGVKIGGRWIIARAALERTLGITPDADTVPGPAAPVNGDGPARDGADATLDRLRRSGTTDDGT